MTTPPIAFFYARLHDGIREELREISENVMKIYRAAAEDAHDALEAMHRRLKFLAQVYNYHSVAEDEVVYPALDKKVKNVTLPYRVEHADEGHLFVQLMQLLVSLPAESDRMGCLRELACKIEEVSTTIHKHLDKEEQQLFPLLLEHFSHTEQASMIAQFLFCIPMMMVESFLNWIQPPIQQDEWHQLIQSMRHAISDHLLLSLLTTWLTPSEAGSPEGSWEEAAEKLQEVTKRAPLWQIADLHKSIDLSLSSFIEEARDLLEQELDGDQLMSLLEKQRFLKDVCRFHMLSEEEIMFPELQKQGQDSVHTLHAEHLNEGAWFDDLGRLLTDVRSRARRGSDEAQALLKQVVTCAEVMRDKLGAHMTREEREVFPLLQEKLGSGEQCLIVWRTLKMMPLRLLERVMPWISSQLSQTEYRGWMASLKVGGIEEASAVELLSKWAQRGCPEQQSRESPSLSEGEARLSKRFRREGSGISDSSTPKPPNPVDHIFQFHRALQRDFRLFAADTGALVKAVEEGGPLDLDSHVQQLRTRFTFLCVLYQAHSKIEDEVMFPVLESKEATRNICHSYMLDHRQEEALFDDIRQMLSGLIEGSEVHELALKLSRKSSAARSALETHIRAEETELWPLFVEHFTIEEQQRIVGHVIGRTGAEILQTMLPWVSTCFTEEEKDAMMESLHSATKKTRFEKWMQNWSGSSSSPSEPSTSESLSESLSDVELYLKGSGLKASVSEFGDFSPGFEDILRMNQRQLEAAVRHVSSDPSLEPQRKSYLIQRILASKYITHQQSKISAFPEGTPQGQPFQSYACEEEGLLGCVHYQRNCALVTPCCQSIYVCRLCHDAEQDHKLNRFAVEEILCMLCGSQQPVTNECSSCGQQMGRYHCRICRLYDNQAGREIYHCPFCNVCRRGKGLGVDFYHCMECNACMHTSTFNRHQCREKRIECDCAVCRESLFDSSLPIKELRCGHFMHVSCFVQYSQWNYRCPVCFKSFGDMSAYFRMLDSFLASDPMPEALQSCHQSILCHDCGKESEAPFHFVYHRCQHCHSYNTRLL